jgi:hypothetical protein
MESPKNMKEFRRKDNMSFSEKITVKPFSGRLRPMATGKEVTPAANFCYSFGVFK